MEQQQMTAEEIYVIAQKMATQFLVKEGLSKKHHLIEDATQEIGLAGFQDLKETNEVDKIKKRMRDRLKSWWGRYCAREAKQPIPQSSFPLIETEDGEEITAYDLPRNARRVNLFQELAVREFIENSLTLRQQQIVRMTAAEFSNKEIALELGVSTRTIKRERDLMKAKYRHDFDRRETLLKFRRNNK